MSTQNMQIEFDDFIDQGNATSTNNTAKKAKVPGFLKNTVKCSQKEEQPQAKAKNEDIKTNNHIQHEENKSHCSTQSEKNPGVSNQKSSSSGKINSEHKNIADNQNNKKVLSSEEKNILARFENEKSFLVKSIKDQKEYYVLPLDDVGFAVKPKNKDEVYSISLERLMNNFVYPNGKQIESHHVRGSGSCLAKENDDSKAHGSPVILTRNQLKEIYKKNIQKEDLFSRFANILANKAGEAARRDIDDMKAFLGGKKYIRPEEFKDKAKNVQKNIRKLSKKDITDEQKKYLFQIKKDLSTISNHENLETRLGSNEAQKIREIVSKLVEKLSHLFTKDKSNNAKVEDENSSLRP